MCGELVEEIRRRRPDGQVHPRVCGELIERFGDRNPNLGSSPRVRGTPIVVVVVLYPLRFIPACAGNSADRHASRVASAVHPRVCGELRGEAEHVFGLLGSSPRVRGTRTARHPSGCRSRFIPACAGNSARPRRTTPSWTVHPRVCGELRGTRRWPFLAPGSSPRVRGTLPGIVLVLAARRFIPACAGNSRSREPQQHPAVGSSPRVRGTRRSAGGRRRQAPVHPRVCGELVLRADALRRAPRFIPACAGNSRPPSRSASRTAVHPRVCGELLAPGNHARVDTGSSPRVRGTPDQPGGPLLDLRFIPACAGNSRPPSRSASRTTVHPRVCGELAPLP